MSQVDDNYQTISLMQAISSDSNIFKRIFVLTNSMVRVSSRDSMGIWGKQNFRDASSHIFFMAFESWHRKTMRKYFNQWEQSLDDPRPMRVDPPVTVIVCNIFYFQGDDWSWSHLLSGHQQGRHWLSSSHPPTLLVLRTPRGDSCNYRHLSKSRTRP